MMIIFFLSLVSNSPAVEIPLSLDQNPQDFLLPTQPQEASVGLKKEHQLQQAEIEGKIVAPQGFQEFKDVVPRSRRMLEERLQFKLWEATRLGF